MFRGVVSPGDASEFSQSRTLSNKTLAMALAKRIYCTLLIVCFALFLQLAPTVGKFFEWGWSNVDSLFDYRLITCHAVHWSWNHLAWDLLMFSVLGAICESTNRIRFIVYLIVSTIVIPIFVFACHPELSTYRGLSGIDSGLFALVAIDGLSTSRTKNDRQGIMVFSACLFCLVAKIALEITFGGNLFVRDSSFVPVPIAHLVGAITGALTGLLMTKGSNEKPGLQPLTTHP